MSDGEMIRTLSLESVIRDIHFDGNNRTIAMGPNSVLHDVAIAPDVHIVNAAFIENGIGKHQGLFPRESNAEYLEFLAKCETHSVEAQKVIDAIKVLEETKIIPGRFVLEIGCGADGEK